MTQVNTTFTRCSIEPRADPGEYAIFGLGLNAIVLVYYRHAKGHEARETIDTHADAGREIDGGTAGVGIRNAGDALLVVPLAIEFENEVERLRRLLHVAVIVIGVIETMLLRLVLRLHAILMQFDLLRRADGTDQAI